MTPSLPHTPARKRNNRSLVALTLSAVLAATLTVVPASAHADLGDLIAGLFSRTHRTTVEMDTPAGQIKMRLVGNVVFTDAEDDVLSLDGRAMIQEKRKGQVIRITFESDGARPIKRTYTVDGREQALDAEGKRWLAELIPSIYRQTGIDSNRRIKRIHSRGGPDAVLLEIEQIKLDYARRLYIEGLAEMGPLDGTRLGRLLNTTDTIGSDFERRSALNSIIRTQTLGSAHQVALLKGVAKMRSSFEQRGVLVALTPKLASDAEVMQAWQAAANAVSSDFEARGAIEALAQRESLSPLQAETALRATLKISSDFEHASALKAIARRLETATPKQVGAYVESAKKIRSDFERSSALVAMVNLARLDAAGYTEVLRATEGMSSAFEVRSVLTAIASRMPADHELVAHYRTTAKRLGDFERGQAEKALDRLNL